MVAPVLLLLSACGPTGGDADGSTDGADAGELVVFAAASLTDVIDDLADGFTAANPQVVVVRNLAGSQRLAGQINEGAPADVFASANTTQMDAVAAAGNLASEPEVLTTNRLEIAVEPGNPLSITGLVDLADPELLLVLPAEGVPAGRYARQVLDAADVQVTPSSLEQDVRAARAKVELGEADAAIVYASDILASDAVDGVPIPPQLNVTAVYPIAVLAEAPNPAAADAFVAYALSAEGQEILAANGFEAP